MLNWYGGKNIEIIPNSPWGQINTADNVATWKQSRFALNWLSYRKSSLALLSARLSEPQIASCGGVVLFLSTKAHNNSPGHKVDDREIDQAMGNVTGPSCH